MTDNTYRRSIVWSPKLTAYVSRSFLDLHNVPKVNGRYEIDPALCSIRENIFGYYDLMFKGRIVRRISFEEYLNLRNIVADSYKEVLE